jgi:hypothetical protein
LVTTGAGVWIPLSAHLTTANVADHGQAGTRLPELPTEVRDGTGDQHNNDAAIDPVCAQAGRTVVARSQYP